MGPTVLGGTAHPDGQLHRALHDIASSHTAEMSYEAAKKRAEPYTKIVGTGDGPLIPVGGAFSWPFRQ